jgi:hypothetical protein
MHPQLLAIHQEFEAASARFERLVDSTSDTEWGMRPAPNRWSVAECISHLNLTAEAFVPLIRGAMRGAPRTSGEARYRRSLIGWMLWKMMPPPVKLSRAPTIPAMVPGSDLERPQLEGEFRRLQEEQLAVLAEAEGAPLDRIRISSPFNPRVKYDLFSAISILPRHEDRHLWQAEMALEQLRTGSPG